MSKNAFMTALEELGGGSTSADLGRALTELVKEVQMVGKPGTLTFTMKVTPKANSPQILITEDIKVAAPKPDRETTILYADDKHELSRRDPRQPRLSGLSEVRSFAAAAGGEVPANVDKTTGEILES